MPSFNTMWMGLWDEPKEAVDSIRDLQLCLRSFRRASPSRSEIEHLTIVATADSGYEYLLKQWIQSDITSAKGMIDNLVYRTPTCGLLYAGDTARGSLDHRLEHLMLPPWSTRFRSIDTP
ncbi:hypothetical protein BYT27DRAFT_7257581 [Phlegmacium glaucopus]|nr:hypothetical protein BYT27DRAFT_7257581 [Phlegmacium glaucopus]